MSDKFYTSEQHFELLRKAGLDTILGVNTDTPFLAEVAFLNFWNRDLEGLPAEEGLDSGLSEYEAVMEAGGPTIYITFDVEGDGTEFDRVSMVYTPDPAQPRRYGLQIIWNDNLVYERTADQDERTEWNINCMADDDTVTDDGGNMLFVGDPTNI